MKLLDPYEHKNDDAGIDVAGYSFYCPGCGYRHSYYTRNSKGRPVWSFDGNMQEPTFKPSLRMLGGRDAKKTTCHLFVTKGKIIYCDDCPHELAGKTVDMVPLDA